LTDSLFQNFQKNRFNIYKADFPQRKELSKETIRVNEELAEKYNPQGLFPCIILLNKNREVIANLAYRQQNAEIFTKELSRLLPKPEPKEYKYRISAMGSFFEFIIVEDEGKEDCVMDCFRACADEVNKVENLISEWIPYSEVSKINKNAGLEPVEVSNELYLLIQRSIGMGDLTQGAFDITFHGLGSLWKFDGSIRQPPDSTLVASLLDKIDYRRIQLLDENNVYLPVKGMAVGFGGNGQGYAVDRVRQLLEEKEIENFVINSSGDIYAKGKRVDGSKWKIGIADPVNKETIIRWLEVDGKAVVTSGNYEKYFEYEGQRYAHIINPKTGWPTKGILSTTVIGPSTEVCDVLATALFVLGIDVGIHLVDQLPNTECIIIDDKKNVSYSRGLLIKK
jgi:thiamine biosynthesis lipoprotein